jgi:hypothetical protein
LEDACHAWRPISRTSCVNRREGRRKYAAVRYPFGVRFLCLLLVGCSGAPVELQRPAGVALCYSARADQLAVTRDYWNAAGAADYAGRPALLQSLAEAAKQYPDEEEVALLNGLGNLWRIAEPAPSDDPNGFVSAALTAKIEVQRALELCPTDYRIPAWLGPILVNMGKQLNDPPTIDQGLQVLQSGIDHYAAFVLFSKLLVYADRPVADADFQQALQAVDANRAACTPRDPACVNTPHAVHNSEGAALFLGDVYVKAGRKEDALAVFRAAQNGKDYAAWPFRSLLEDRISGIDARLASWAAGTDPGSAWNSNTQCSVCHQVKAP